MNQRDRRTDHPGADHEDTAVRLLRLAGHRPEIDPRRAARVQAAVKQRWQNRVEAKEKIVRFPVRRIVLSVAAVLVLGLTAVFWRADLLQSLLVGAPIAAVELVEGEAWRALPGADGPAPLSANSELVAGSQVGTGTDGRLALRLADGHSLRLDRQSQVKFASATEIELTLGTLYVDSGGDHEAQVSILTRLGMVREIGTQFEVSLVEEGLRVRVREGRVEVLGGDERHEVLAGRQLIRRPDGHVNVDDIVRFGESWGWVGEITPPFSLDGRILGEYLVWVSREAGLEVRFEPGDLAQTASGIRLHGELPSMQPQLTPQVVLPTCGLIAEIDGGVMTVMRERNGN